MAKKSTKKSSNELTDFMQAISDMSTNNTANTFAFNANEAEKARQYSAYMSNTSHQREVEDLKLAGLNPVLSANSGAQSYSANSASASADPTAVNALANIFMNEKTNAMNYKLGQMNYQVGLSNAAATRFAASANAAAAMAAAGMNANAMMYSADQNRIAQMYSAKAGITQAQINKASAQYVSDNNASGSWPGMIKWMLKGAENSGAPWSEWSSDLNYRD